VSRALDRDGVFTAQLPTVYPVLCCSSSDTTQNSRFLGCRDRGYLHDRSVDTHSF
jgi:hypothetical protein